MSPQKLPAFPSCGIFYLCCKTCYHWNRNLQVHKAEKQFECPVCPMTFRHKNSLVRHLCQHTGERPYRCQCCDSAFISMHRLKDHMKKQHPETLSDMSSFSKPISEESSSAPKRHAVVETSPRPQKATVQPQTRIPSEKHVKPFQNQSKPQEITSSVSNSALVASPLITTTTVTG